MNINEFIKNSGVDTSGLDEKYAAAPKAKIKKVEKLIDNVEKIYQNIRNLQLSTSDVQINNWPAEDASVKLIGALEKVLKEVKSKL